MIQICDNKYISIHLRGIPWGEVPKIKKRNITKRFSRLAEVGSWYIDKRKSNEVQCNQI